VKSTSLNRAQHGFTIVELMIAITVGLVLSAGVLQLFVRTTKINLAQDNLSRLQETGRFAMEYLSRDIRMAGYPRVSFSGDAVQGTNDDGLNNSDSITVGSGLSTDTGTLDCLGQAAAPVTNKYYIANDSNGVPNLYCLGSGNATAQPLLEGVENMQVLYGVDTDSDKSANKYLRADQLSSSDWLNVVSVRISLLLRTTDNGLATQQTAYSYNGVSVTPSGSDYYLRRVFTTTITLRNRLI